MFALFFSLYYSMFLGRWISFTNLEIAEVIKNCLNPIGQLLTSLFNNVDTPMTDLGTTLSQILYPGTANGYIPFYGIIALILAIITSIGIVVVATKGIKKLFTVFFYGVR